MYDIREGMSDEMLAFLDASNEDRESKFAAAVRQHDVTFEYSDDGAMWRRGSDQRNVIRSMATFLSEGFVKSTWNKRMDEMFTADEAPRWYWR
jgi:hypothetical protein